MKRVTFLSIVWAALAVTALIISFWNEGHIFSAGLSALMCVCSLKDEDE